MAHRKQTAQEFIQNIFSPHVAVLCSNDAEILCQKNNLSFSQLVQPFCRLTSEAHIKDPNNVQHSIQQIRINMVDMNSHAPTSALAKKLMNDAVSNEQLQMTEGNRCNVITVGDYDLQLSPSTPWFEAYRECFIQTMPPSEHEFLKDCLACIFVVSSNHSDPLAMLHTLSNTQQQQQTQFPNKLPHWFCANILKYYVLVHDSMEGEASKVEAVYQSMKSTFGHQSCHLLQINSKSLTAVDTVITTDASLPDPWGLFINKTLEPVKKPVKAKYFIAWEGVDYNGSGTSRAEDGVFPSRLEEGTYEVGNNSYSGIDRPDTLNNSLIDHPLALSDQSPMVSPVLDESSSDNRGSTNSLNNMPSALTKSLSFMSDRSKTTGGHGMCLTTSDLDRIRIFIHEFSVRALIPWAEKQMRTLSDQLASRTGIRKSIVGTAKKWFGGNPSKTSQVANTATTVVYSKDAPELQMRHLADLAFVFQLYDFAYQTYHTAKRDFNNDHAWLHFAGALEMACLSVFMLGNQSQKSYPDHYMESAITTYLQSCKNVPYAVRATLISTEALKSRSRYKEAATQYIKMLSEESDLRSALLLEQAAHCFINMQNPMVRKYSFHMTLAGHRFSKAGQRKHALRAYSQALQIYKGKQWTLAEDHINFTIGRQSHNLKQLENATAAFKHLLSEHSQQAAMQQNAFLREYLFVYKQLLMQEAEETGLPTNLLPELPLPTLDSNSTKVLLGSRPQPPQGEKVYATGVWFDQSEGDKSQWIKLEELLVSSANGGSLPLAFRPTLQLYSNTTDNKSSPVGYIREPITIELYLINPLKVALTLTDVSLLWSFLPTVASHDKPQPITNEHMITAKNNLADEIVHGQVIKEIVLQGNERLPVQLTLTPQQMGDLRIYGITYNLGSATTSFMAPSQSSSGPLGNSMVGSKASYVSTVFLRGKQRIDVQGPRLNVKKEEMVNKMYGPDCRLDLVIENEMPILQVAFMNFPQTLLCGEVHPVTLSFSNTGSSPLCKLRVASSKAQYFVLGAHSEQPNFNEVYKLEMAKDSIRQSECNAFRTPVIITDGFNTLNNVMIIDIPGGILHPNHSVSVQAWVRGNDIGGIHEMDLLFYYQSTQQFNKQRHRLLQHTVLVNTVESLAVRAMAQRSTNHCLGGQSENIRKYIISCELENLSQQQSQKCCVQEIQLQQISCASSKWTFKSLSLNKDVCLGSREMFYVCFKAELLQSSESPNSNVSSVTFTDIPLVSHKISSSETPCRDFFQRARSKLSSVDIFQTPSSTTQQQLSGSMSPDQYSSLNSAIELGITLIILWKASIVDASGGLRTCVGQHHVTIEKPDVFFTSYPFVMVPKERPQVKFVKDEELEQPKGPAFEVLTSLVTYTLLHETDVSNCFTNRRICCVPVMLVVVNGSDADVTILVDTGRAQQRLNEFQEVGQIVESSSYSFAWVGQTLKHFKLSPAQAQHVPLMVTFSKPGVFNINNLAMFVTYKNDASEMTLQKHAKPCVIQVRDIAA